MKAMGNTEARTT